MGELYHTEITELSEVIHYEKKLLKDGRVLCLFQWPVMVPYCLPSKGSIQSNVLKRPLKNSVGAGDSMIAGFVGRWTRKRNESIETFKLGVACRSARHFQMTLRPPSLFQVITRSYDYNFRGGLQ